MDSRRGLLKPHSCFSFVVYCILILGAFLKCAIAKIGFEKNMVSQGFEALARAQYLLRSQTSLAKLRLLSQVKGPLFLFVNFFTLIIRRHFYNSTY